jgi:hypothetical protein
MQDGTRKEVPAFSSNDSSLVLEMPA